MMGRSGKRLGQGLILTLILGFAVFLIVYVNRAPAPVAGKPPTTNPAMAMAEPARVSSPPTTAPARPLIVTQTPAPTAGGVPIAQVPTTKPSWDTLMGTAAASSGAAAPARAGAMPATGNLSLDETLKTAAEQAVAGNLSRAIELYSAAMTRADYKASTQQVAEIKKLAEPVGRLLLFTPKRSGDGNLVTTYQVQPGDSMQKIARQHFVTWELLGRVNDISDPRKLRAGRAIKALTGPYGAIVDKSDFTMEIWWMSSPTATPGEPGSAYLCTFRVGLGRNDSTPTGTWVVTKGGKLKNPKFWGAGDLPPIEADDPQNPLGEFWIALTGVAGNAEGRESYGIHGTIDPASIGQQSSLGCIRLADADIQLVYELLVDGASKVVVRD